MYTKDQINNMIGVIENCIKEDKIEFLATIILNLQREYQEIATLSTDGEYQIGWTHNQVLDHLTYQPKR